MLPFRNLNPESDTEYFTYGLTEDIIRLLARNRWLDVLSRHSGAAFKDREVMARVPHRLIEGCLIAAHAIESTDVFIYIRGEYLAEYEILTAAVEEAREAEIFGEVQVTVHRGAGAYICGEETALLESLEGKRGQPRPRPPFPPIQGLYMAPTQINNVCTIATVPVIMEMGAEEFAKTGVPSSPGTAIFSVSGNVVRPGNYELDLGTPMRDLIFGHAGGIADGRELKAVIPGGSSVPALTPDEIDVPLDYDSLGAIGTFFGAASLIVVGGRSHSLLGGLIVGSVAQKLLRSSPISVLVVRRPQMGKSPIAGVEAAAP